MIGDCHFCDTVPVRRTDDFIAAQFRKMDGLIRIIQGTEQIDGVFLLGDVFDVHSPKVWLINEVIRKFNEVRFCLPDREVPIYAIVGNHCVHGRVAGVHDVGLGTLFDSGVVTRLHGDKKISGINVRGLDYELKHTIDMYATDVPRIMFTHNMITPANVIFEHILAKDVAASLTDSVVFAGHYHPPFKFKNPHTNTHILNPGVMIRTDISEISTDPSVILFNATPATKGFEFAYEILSLGGSKGSAIFDVEEYKKDKADELNLRQFIESIKTTRFQSQDIEQLIQETGKASNVQDNVVTEALERIREAKASV